MTHKLLEDKIEQLTIELLQNIGYQYIHGSLISPDGEQPERAKYSDVILKKRLIHAINKLNFNIPLTAREKALCTLTNINSSDLINNNKICHQYLIEGIKVEFKKEG